jgi:hypothetical protein
MIGEVSAVVSFEKMARRFDPCGLKPCSITDHHDLGRRHPVRFGPFRSVFFGCSSLARF